MCKAACHSDRVDSSNPHRWRGKRLHHHGGGVCWLFVLLWMDLCCHELIICKKRHKNNLKMRLMTLLFDPHWHAPHLYLTNSGICNVWGYLPGNPQTPPRGGYHGIFWQRRLWSLHHTIPQLWGIHGQQPSVQPQHCLCPGSPSPCHPGWHLHTSGWHTWWYS